MTLDPAIAQAFETTWPAAQYSDAGGYRIGRGMGGGGRISSARPLSDQASADAALSLSAEGILAAAAVQQGWDQPAMFRLWDTDHDHAQALGAQGYHGQNPTLALACPIAALTQIPVPSLTVFQIWPPLAILSEIWEAGQISKPRQAAMMRVNLPRTTLLGRLDDHAAAAGFVAVDGDVAMIHAIQVEPRMRRRGMAEWMLREAAFWAGKHGATQLALAVTESNTAAVQLYRKMGFQTVARYQYWQRRD
ncbi:GNAT family N-acetyltransferase [Paracoccus sp. (in: a-proteobacteria)]|uniref:GNAT family N-acetyltransferase n=1 Tax=Paracoccus sp. TaxID=267 RepID=UPI00289FA74B|nr:GNAT family N-acetyltransferase [Paracoccus sp. (in: a-proteobacteria)]